MTVAKLEDLTALEREQCAELLFEGFAEHWPNGWSTIEEARDEVESFLIDPDRKAFAIVNSGMVIGWIGRVSMYDGNVWELHPMVVRQEFRGKGMGRLLVEVLEAAAREAGVLTLWLGTDDEDAMTSLANTDLFDDTFSKLQSIQNLKQHPYSFYQKVGFKIMGVVPDANGKGKPDILMAKSLIDRTPTM